jgi:hypothetical protein
VPTEGQHVRIAARCIRSSNRKPDLEAFIARLTYRSCGGPLPGREGKFVLKYFLLRNHDALVPVKNCVRDSRDFLAMWLFNTTPPAKVYLVSAYTPTRGVRLV